MRMDRKYRKVLVVVCLAVMAEIVFAVSVSAATPPLGLPAPVEWAAPSGAPAAPGDPSQATFADPSGTVSPNAPVIAEWNRTTKPGESFTMTGVRFTLRAGADSGTDSTVWVWADTPSGGTLRQMKVWKLTDTIITATIPEDVPFGMFLIWVENEAGASSPICMNRTQGQWIGPLGASAASGETKRVFGKNLSYGHGTTTSYVYLQPSSGGAFVSCPVTGVEPFAVKFTIPVGTANGSYKVYVHSGHGGEYGWSEPVDLTVASAWTRGTAEAVVNPTGVDDAAAIQSAINQMTAQPNGGTVRLAAGTYILKSNIGLKANVRIAGAGKSLTTVQARLTSSPSQLIDCLGDHVAIEDLSIHIVNTGYAPVAQAIRQPYPFQPPYTDMIIKNIKMTEDTGLECMALAALGPRCVVSGCEFYMVIEVRDDGWIHDNILHGGAYSIPGWPNGNEYPAQGGPRVVFENNFTSTPAWPVGPNGNRNFLEFMTYDDIRYLTWAKRMFGVGGSNNYIAHNTTQDVACEENKGEMILFHGFGGSWWGQCISTTGLTTTVHTDSLVFGETITHNGVYGTVLTGSTPVPDGVDGFSAVVVLGAGVGQRRTIVSHTSSSITVDSPWRVGPDSSSVLVIVGMYQDHIVYKNELNALPPGYKTANSNSASNGCQIDGNGWGIELEGNVSRRNMYGRELKANSTGVSFWNTLRNEEAYELGRRGFWNMTYEDNPAGFENLGNRFVGCTAQITGENPTLGLGICETGGIAENCNISGGQQGLYVGQEALYRNNTVSVRYATSTPQPVYVLQTDANPTLVGNTYSGWSPTYSTIAGCTFGEKPLSLHHVARFSGYVGYPVESQLVPIANAGISSLAWTATPSDSWITASIQSNPTLSAESTLGRLVIGVNTSGLSAGRRWGSVTVNTGAMQVKVGVCLDLSASSPSNSSPVASFTVTPAAGVTPLAVTLNGSASYDSDGIISEYRWDYGDGSFGTGTTASHTYSTVGVYTPTLTVTDNSGLTSTYWTNVTVCPVLSGLTLSGTPRAPVAVSTPVTLTASAIGGYQVQYKFLVNSGAGWSTLQDYSTSNTATWTPASSGFYRVKVYARNTGSSALYDLISPELGYPVGLLPADNLVLWLKADAGVTWAIDGEGKKRVSSWLDQSAAANNVTQSFSGNQPNYTLDSGNGKPAVTFTGGSSKLAATGRVMNSTSGFTCFGLVKYNGTGNPTNNQHIFWNGVDTSSSGYGWYIDSSGYLNANWGSYSGMITDLSGFPGGVYHTISSRLSSNSHQLWVDGTLRGSVSKTGSNFTSGVFTLGGKMTTSYGLDGDIQEMIIYSRSLSDTERSAVESYLSMRYQPRTVSTIPQAKALSDGTSVSITSTKVVTVSSGVYSDGSYYIEEPDRFAALRVLGYSGQPSLAVGDRVTLSGVIETADTGERVFVASKVDSIASGEPVGPLGMAGKSLTGNGLLIRVWGRVTEKTSSYLTIDDGSGQARRALIDGLATPITSLPDVGAYVSVTGPSGLAAGGVPVVRPTGVQDIRVY